MCALKEPELDLIQLNRYLTYLKYSNIETAICFNKGSFEIVEVTSIVYELLEEDA